jgi:adenosyl cobinamide kinase/adenosyl cobinamide phosphate guanylyltransferase
MIDANDARRANKIATEQFYPLLVGLDPGIQSAVLADCLATWLAGHQMSDRAELERMREELLAEFIALVRELVPVNEAIIFGREQ